MRMAYDRLMEVVRRGLDAGARLVGPAKVLWDVAGRCECSRLVQLTAYRPPDVRSHPDVRARLGLAAWREDSVGAIFLDMEVKCRKCPMCLKSRRALWASRAISEIRAAERTWFGTLTIRPTDRYRALMQARSDCQERAVDFDALSAEDQFLEKHRVLGAEVTKYVKRVRAQRDWEWKLREARSILRAEGWQLPPLLTAEQEAMVRRVARKLKLPADMPGLRLLVVVEAHKDGEPHYHILLHEPKGSPQVGERLLRQQWALGFVKFKLVAMDGEDTSRSAWYIAKYLGKAALARVRASIAYGDTTLESIVPVETGQREKNDSQADGMRVSKENRRDSAAAPQGRQADLDGHNVAKPEGLSNTQASAHGRSDRRDCQESITSLAVARQRKSAGNPAQGHTAINPARAGQIAGEAGARARRASEGAPGDPADRTADLDNASSRTGLEHARSRMDIAASLPRGSA